MHMNMNPQEKTTPSVTAATSAALVMDYRDREERRERLADFRCDAPESHEITRLNNQNPYGKE